MCHYFQDIIFNFEKAYFILDELLMAGEMQVGETKILALFLQL